MTLNLVDVLSNLKPDSEEHKATVTMVWAMLDDASEEALEYRGARADALICWAMMKRKQLEAAGVRRPSQP